jgi:peptide deformylase
MSKNWKPKTAPFFEFKKKRSSENSRVSEFIYEVGESDMLRKPSKEIPVTLFKDKEIQQKFIYVKDCLIKYRKITGMGRGLTAVQVGIPLSFSAIYTGQTIQNINNNKMVSYDDITIVANPKVLKVSKKLLKYPEMCMSLSPVVVPTIRPSWVEFKYFDELGNKKLWNNKDDTPVGVMMNRVFLHELDHIKGIVNIDIVKNTKEIILDANPDFYSSAKFEEVK